jgi:HPr kinase/phosphorylase
LNQTPRQVLHATCVASGDRGLLILGGSGTGKSALALKLIALGAALIADDQVAIEPDGTGLRAFCPRDSIRGMIEARGFGLLHMAAQTSARLILALDLDRIEGARLPPSRQVTLLGRALPLAHAPKGDHLPFALYCHLNGAVRDLGPDTGPDLARDLDPDELDGGDGRR